MDFIDLIGMSLTYMSTNKYDINFSRSEIESNFSRLINQLWKTIPMRENQEEMKKQKQMVKQCLSQLFFPSYQVLFTPRSLIFKREEDTIIIDENNFDFIQFYIDEISCFSKQRKDEEYNPQSKKAKEIAEKLKRGRCRKYFYSIHFVSCYWSKN